ncbi:MAG: hypothetical protein C4539_19805 [Ignavibacteriales bacterium]|nr:MAG: hypothetical protein C4539_19805 [Ignavibacteriales bacterium]
MKQIFHIVKYKALSFLKLNPVHNVNDFMKSAGSFIVYAGFAVGTYFLTQTIIHYLLLEVRIGLFLLHQFLSIIMFIFFLSVNVGNIIVSYSTLYKSGEVNFLLTKPVSPTKIFIIKFLDNFFYSSSTMLLIILAAILGYGAYFKLSVINVLSIVLFNFLPFMFIAASLGVIILLFIMKISIRIPLRYIVYVLSAAYVILLFLFFKINSPLKLVSEVMEYYPNLDQYFSGLIPPIIKFLPNNWLTDCLFWTVLGDYSRAAEFYFYQVTVSLLMFFFAAYLGNRFYYKTWLNNINAGNKTRTKIDGKKQSIDFEKESSLSPHTEVILKREILTFVREPNQVIHLLLLLFLIFIFIVSMRGVSLLGTRVIQLQTINYLSVFSFNIFLISTLAMRFVFPLASLEGEAFWKVKSSPVLIRKIFKIKILIYLVPIIIISQLLSYFSNRIFSSRLIVLIGILIAFIAAAFVYINAGMGCIFANFREKNAIRISSSQGAAISFLISLLFIAFQIAILFVPLHNLFQLRRNTGVYDLSFLIIPAAIIIIISVMASFISFKLGIKSLQKDF